MKLYFYEFYFLIVIIFKDWKDIGFKNFFSNCIKEVVSIRLVTLEYSSYYGMIKLLIGDAFIICTWEELWWNLRMAQIGPWHHNAPCDLYVKVINSISDDKRQDTKLAWWRHQMETFSV